MKNVSKLSVFALAATLALAPVSNSVALSQKSWNRLKKTAIISAIVAGTAVVADFSFKKISPEQRTQFWNRVHEDAGYVWGKTTGASKAIVKSLSFGYFFGKKAEQVTEATDTNVA